MIKHVRRFIRWLYRDSDSGKLLSKKEFDKRDKATTTREKL